MLGIDAGDTQTTADVLYRVANQVDGRNENRELCGIQDVAREEAHRNTDAAAHAHDCSDENSCRFTRQSPERHDGGTDHTDDMQETCDIEDADDDEGHDDVRKKTRRANLETIACAIDKEIKDILFRSFRRCHLHYLQSYLSGRTFSGRCASDCHR